MEPELELELEQVSVQFGTRVIVDHMSFALKEGQWLMLVGPNGAGKSTLINAISGGVPYTGSILVQGRSVRKMKPAELARQIGVLAQRHQTGYAYSVQEIVSLGRYAYRKGIFSGADDESIRCIDKALQITGMEKLRDKKITQLSGGEVQRAFLAQVFAQNPDILILDEPANHLDLVYQKQVFELIASWLQKPGKAVISVVHDLSLAKRFGTHAVLLKEGRCVAKGAVNDVLTAGNLQKVYDMDVYGWMQDMYSQWK